MSVPVIALQIVLKLSRKDIGRLTDILNAARHGHERRPASGRASS
jgi:hypothetical protein